MEIWRMKEKYIFGSQSFAIKDAERLLFESKAAVKKDQPINNEGD